MDFEKMDTERGIIQFVDLDGKRLNIQEVTRWIFNQRTETDAFGNHPYPVTYLGGAEWGESRRESLQAGQGDQWLSRRSDGVWRCYPITPAVWPPPL